MSAVPSPSPASLPTPRLQIDASPDTVLSPEQRAFNDHLARLATLRQSLTDWRQAIDAFHQRYAREYAPLLRTLRELHRGLVRFLDQRADGKGLSRADRATIEELIADLVPALLGDDAATDAELQAILQRHGAPSPADETTPAAEPAPTEDDEEDPDSPEAIVRRVEREMQARREAAEQAARSAQARRRSRQKAPPALKQAIETHEASQSLRAVYRQLASALHPDREPDAAERERKTALMQRVNAAYAREDLLSLLELQQEAEQLDLARVAQAGRSGGATPERLAHYNHVLERQVSELEREIADTEAAFRRDHGFGPRERLAPDTLNRALARLLRALQDEIDHLRAELPLLADDRQLKPWLKFQRRADQAGTAGSDDDA